MKWFRFVTCFFSFSHTAELNSSTKTHFPIEYSKLKENFQESGLAKWPLPSCRKAFRVIEGKKDC